MYHYNLRKEQDVDVNPLPYHDDRVAMTIVADSITNNNNSTTNVVMQKQKTKHEILPDNDLTIRAFQDNTKFKSLFDQLGYDPKARVVAIKALIWVFSWYGPEYYTTKTEVNRAYLKSTNTIIFSDEDIEVINPYQR